MADEPSGRHDIEFAQRAVRARGWRVICRQRQPPSNRRGAPLRPSRPDGIIGRDAQPASASGRARVARL